MDLVPKYPHPAGKTCLAYSTCGKYLFTAGSNNLIRRFSVGVNEEPYAIDASACPLAIAASEQHFAVAGEDGIAYLFDLTATTAKSLLARSALPIRYLEFSPKGDMVAVIGDDTALIVSVENESPIKIPFEGRALAIKFHPSEPLVSVVCLNGSISIVDISGDEPRIVNSLEFLAPSIPDPSDNRCSFGTFSPQGSSLALPTKTFQVAVYDTQSWLQEFRLPEGHTNYLTDLQWSPNGRYIVSTGRDGQIIVWDAVNREAVRKLTMAEVTQVRWHPNANEISFTTAAGRLYTCPAVPEELPTPLGAPIHTARKQRALERELEDLVAEPRSDGMEEDDETIDGDDGDANGGYDDDLFVEQPRKRARPTYAAPRKFNPGTPWLNNKRYLCMNNTGYVWTVHQDADHNTVTISFHDESVHRDIHFTDADQFDMASLSAVGCLFANSGSGLVSMRFHQSSSDNWQFQLEEGDKVAAVALTDVVAVIASERGTVMTFSVYGMVLDVKRQRGVFALAGHGHHILALRSLDDNTLAYSLEHFSGDNSHGAQCFISDARLDVSPSELRSIFFGEHGDPCVYDTHGSLITLANWRAGPSHARWVPIFDGRSHATKSNNAQETYWPLGIMDNNFVCILLKGQQQYPPIPLPVATYLPLAVPGLGQLESDYVCLTVMTSQLSQRQDCNEEDVVSMETELDKLLLRQFQTAAAENRINKCMCLVRRLHHEQSGEAAVQIALHMDLTRLAEKIQDFLVANPLA